MKLSVFNTAGEDTGKKVDLKNDIFAVEPSDHAIYLDVKQYLANRRQGTSKAKERSEVNRPCGQHQIAHFPRRRKGFWSPAQKLRLQTEQEG